MAIKIIVCIILGYLFGSLSFGYIVGKMNNMDIREHGSGNAGTTNAFRTMGKKAGVITFLGDFLKALIPLLLIKYVIWADVEYVFLLQLIFGISCVLGHNFPAWLHFKGGKGIAVTGGVIVALNPIMFFPGVIIFGGTILLTKYVSVASLIIATLFPVWIGIWKYGDPHYVVIMIIAILYTVSAFYQHRANLQRLANGTENKVGHRK